jgi:hypothetical protein
MIGVTAARTEELLPLRVRLRGLGTIDEETERRDHQQGWQIHLAEQEICPKNRSHPFVLFHNGILDNSALREVSKLI